MMAHEDSFYQMPYISSVWTPGFGIAFALDIVFTMIRKWAAEMIDRMKKKNSR